MTKPETELAALRRAINGSAAQVTDHPSDAISLLSTQLFLDGSEAAMAALDRLATADRPLLRIREQRDLSTGTTGVVVETLDEPLTALAIMGDDGPLLAGGSSGAVRLWRPGDGSLSTLAWLPSGVSAIRPSPDGSLILVITDDGTVQLLDAEGGIVHSVAPDERGTPTVASGLGEGRGLALGYPDGRVVIIDPDDDALELTGHSAAVRFCLALADGRSLLTASDDCTLRLWDLHSGQARARLVGHPAAITACDCHAKAGRLLSADADGGLRLWDCDGRDLGHLPGHEAAVTGCRLSRDANQAISVSCDGTLRFWDCRERSEIGRWRSHNGALTGMLPLSGDFDRDRPRVGSGGPGQVVTWGDAGVVRMHELATGRERFAYRPHHGLPLAVVVLVEQIVIATTAGTLETVQPGEDGAPGLRDRSHDWAGLAVNGDDGSGVAVHRGGIVAWPPLPEDEPRRLPGDNAIRVLFCAHLAERGHFLTLSETGLVTTWDASQSVDLAPPRAPRPRALDLHGRRLSAAVVTESAWSINACAGFDNGEVIAAVLPNEDGEAPAPWDILAHPAAVTTLSVDRSQDVLLSGHADGACLLFDFATGDRVGRLGDHPQAVTASAALPTGQGFLTGCADGVLYWWQPDSETPFLIVSGHQGAIHTCVSGPDGRWAITAGEDATLRFWSLDDGRCVETFHGEAHLPVCSSMPRVPVCGRSIVPVCCGSLMSGRSQPKRYWKLNNALQPMVSEKKGVVPLNQCSISWPFIEY